MGRMILNGTVYGAGSKVKANPDGTATDELKKIDIDSTIYNIAGGTINVYGAFIDTSKILLPETRISGNGSYTAQEDCFITLLYYLGNWATNVALDNEDIISANNMTPNCWNYVIFPVKKGQELTYNLGYNGWLKIYGVKGGSNPISAPIIYSTEEREVGVWVDNKPLYQKTTYFGAISTNANYGLTMDIGANIVDTVIDMFANAKVSSGAYVVLPYPLPSADYAAYLDGYNKSTDKLTIKTGNARSFVEGYATIYYTKTTDTAGSGLYNTLGVPTVHYTTDEQVIGTWMDGKTLYQRTWELSSVLSVASNTWVDTSILKQGIDAIIYINGANAEGAVFSFLGARAQTSTTNYVQIQQTRNSAITLKYITVQYTKTTD